MLRPLPYLIPLALASASVAACSQAQAPHDSVLYVRQLQPLLLENGLLAERVLEGAAQVHDDRTSPASTAMTWKREIAPLARHLHDQAARVDAPSEWVASHQRLVDIWGSRADSYENLADALAEGDRAGWRKSRARADQAKLDEETWFASANARLAPAGISLDQYP